MSSLRLDAGPGLLSGEVSAPPSKSLLHRGLVCAALAGDLSLCPVPDAPSDDVAATLRAVAPLVRRPAGPDPVRVDCGESGTTLRLLVPVFAALGIPAVFEGRGRLPRRPMGPYADALGRNGARLAFPEEPGVYLPLAVSGALRPGLFELPGDVSSQFVSGLLLALPLLSGPSEIRLLSPLQSRSYVEMTLAALRAFGVEARETAAGWSVPGGGRFARTAPWRAEPDASQEAFWRLAAFLGSSVSLAEPAASGLQGDAAFPVLLERLRAAAPDGPPPEIDVSQVPDLVPALAAAAAWSPAGARFVRGERLRLKESDRVATTCAMLRAFGSAAEEEPGGILVPPGPPRPPAGRATVDGAGDHRIVMAAAVLATRTPAAILGAEAVSKSYPSFFDEYRRLGGVAVPR